MHHSITYDLSAIPGFNNLLFREESNHALRLNVSHCRLTDTTYKVVRYDKTTLSNDLVAVYGLCRSIVVNAANKVVAFSPPKSLNAESFMQQYKDLAQEQIVGEEFVEGTMINVFFDPVVNKWEIATRNTVGAESSFYKKAHSKTFRDMFFEAADVCGLHLDDSLDTKYCYSFVLQHPENRIVVPFVRPMLYLVGVYEIEQDNAEHITVQSHPLTNFVHLNIALPAIYLFTTYAEAIERFGSMNTSYQVVGVILRNQKTGERTKIRNPVYEQVRGLRGNQPRLQYQYLCLRREGKVRDFLTYYPENKKELSVFRDQLHLFTNTLYANYISCYVTKTKPLKEFGEQYRTHMFHLHELYRNELKPRSEYVNRAIVQGYVNKLHPSLLMHCLNMPLRKNAVDTIVADATMA
jgi:hypothetical protein